MAYIETNGESLRPQVYVDRYSVWGDTFSSFVWDDQIAEEYANEIAPLKEEVRAKLLNETNNELEKLYLVDILERLGISYHYEEEIDEILLNLFNLIHGFEEENEYDLYDAILLFRILRQHGFDISSEIFEKFKDSNGSFKEELIKDPKGLLSLYEASYVRRHEDDILEDALLFTKSNLKNMTSQLNSCLRKQVEHALEIPLHYNHERSKIYSNITFYGEDESRNEKLLKFAKLDFNLLQMLYKQEITALIRWWKPIIPKFDYTRDRLIECYYLALGQYFEPQYSMGRITACKGLCLVSLIDDTFDVYGKIDELKLLTDAVERWNHDEIDHLPDNMKLVYETIINLHQEFDEELRKIGRSFVLDYWKRRIQEIVKAYYIEATWLFGGCIPSFEEYLSIGRITITVYPMIPIFLFTSKSVTKDIFEWYDANPKILVAAGTQARLFDDTATYEDEKKKGQLTTGIECYMKQYGVSKEEVFAKFHEMMDDAWKDMNGESSRSSRIPMFVFRMILNYARAFEVTFKNDINYYLHVEDVIKFEIMSLLLNPINI